MPDHDWTITGPAGRRVSDGAARAGEHHGHARGRPVPDPVVRQVLRALGVVTCPDCHEVRRIIGRPRALVPPPGRDMMQEHLAGSHGRPETECPRYDHELCTGARCAGRRARLPGRERRTQRQVAPLRYSDARPSCMGEQ